MKALTTAVWRDHRVTTAVAWWSSCMARQGGADDRTAFSTALRLETRDRYR
jgi:hypothetical protein